MNRAKHGLRCLLPSVLLGLGCLISSSCQPTAKVYVNPLAHRFAPFLSNETSPRIVADPDILRIREEGLNHSQVDQTLDYLCNVIGQRLTGSPSQQHASEWTRDTLAHWGLTNAHLEPWGPFGRGWSLEQYSLQVTSPYTIILNGYPKAWSPGFDSPLEADVVYLDAKTKPDLAKYAGQLNGKVVLIGAIRPIVAHFTPEATRMTSEDLAKMAAAPAGRSRSEMLQSSTRPVDRPTTGPGAASRPSVLAQTAAAAFATDEFNFAAKEGAAVIIDNSFRGDGGTLFVASALVPGPTSRPTSQGAGPSTRPKAYAADAPPMPAQITLASEDFDRLVRMIARDQQIKVSLNLKVKYYPPAQVNTANTIAEIPGTDLKDQIVMVGAHLDSWHSGTGATDNGVGSACAMEAVRILRNLNLHPRRTIRIALWTGEEQGLIGSTAYVKAHFGSPPDDPATTQPATQSTSHPAIVINKTTEYDRLSVYFNLDNGSGKIRGVFAQGNTAAVPLFHQWLQPFADLDAATITLANTGSTDHIPFDRIGLPGFQFIQDPIEYGTRTHHSNADVYDRIQMPDMKQASTIMAAFLWDAANMDEKFPRKPAM